MMPTSPQRLLLRNGIIVTVEREVDADVFIEGNRIQKILKRPHKSRLVSQMDGKFTEEIDITGKFLFPGLIDCHVHFREPGLEQKETMATGMAAALAGGVTTVCEMPNTIPPTVTVEAFRDKVRRAYVIPSSSARSAERNEGCDIRFFFGATELQHLHELKHLFTDPSLKDLRDRCCGLKLYLDHSTGEQRAPKGVVDEAFKLCAELGIAVVCHCEDSDMNNELRIMNYESRDISLHSQMRPPESEEKAVRNALALAKKYGTHLHIAHLSTKGGLHLIRAAKKSSVAVTCEVAPHHLFLTIDDYASLGALAKMNPPLRTRDHQEALWGGIADGTVDCIATDHAPHTLEEKGVTLSGAKGEPLKAPSGVPGVETMLPLLLSAISGRWPHPRNLQPTTYNLQSRDILRLCFTNPNHIFNLGKQGIVEGAPADLILVDPKQEWVIQGKDLHSKCQWTPYEEWQVRGAIEWPIQ